MSSADRTALVVGGSVAGSAAALQLSAAGWVVTLVDPELGRLRDPGPAPTVRAGAPQAVHAHGFMARSRVEIRDRMPDLWPSLLEAGARQVSFEQTAPPALYDGGRPADDDLTTLQVRRHTFDRVLADAVSAAPVSCVDQRATGLLLDRSGSVPVVRGVVLEDATVLEAAVTIDAAGRRSPITRWLRDSGLSQPERFDESVARYYTRHYAIVGERPPLNSGFADIHGFTCHVQLLFLGDDDTAMLALAAHDRDPVLKALRGVEAFEALVAANDAFASWHAVLEPTSEVFCLGAFENRVRSLVRDGRPVVSGLHHVGDSLATTNPTRGRGIAMGLLAVGRLVDLLQEQRDAEETAFRFEEWRVRTLLPYYRECARNDSVAAAQLRAGLAGQSIPNNAPAVELPDGHPFTSADLERAARTDPDLFRVLARASSLLDDDRGVASREVARRVRHVLADAGPAEPPRAPPSGGLHDRSRVEALLAAYG